jgi:hypothetical protein
MPEINRTDWRELCAAAAKELDSEKLISLVNQILQEFDECEPGALLSPRSTPATSDIS